MPTRRFYAVVSLALLLLLIAAGCAAPAAPSQPVEQPAQAPAEAAQPAAEEAAPEAAAKTLVMAISEDTASLDPARAFETLPTIIHKATYETLVTFPADSVSSIEPALAESWTISDDGTVYTFTLRDSAKFANGDPVTAGDVVFSFNRMKNIKGNPSFLAETIQSVAAPDDKTVVLTLTAPDPAILAKLIFSAFSVVNKAEVEAQGGTDAEDAATADTAEQWLNSHSAGSGPYMLESWDPSVETVLVRNPNYWGEPPAIDRVIIRNIPEAATQKIQLEAGDIDIAMDLSSDQVPSLKDNPAVSVFEGLSDTIVFLIMNEDESIGGPMSDPLVQKAIRYGLDYEGILLLAGGQAVSPASVIPVGFLGAYGPDKAFVRDVEQAKALLADAGYGDGLDVELEYPDFTFAGINFGTFAQKVQADLGEIGINVSLKPAEVQVALENYRQGKESFGLWLWLPDYRDPLDYVEFLPAGVVGNRANWTDDNADPAILSLRDMVKVETNDAKRVELFGQIQDYLQDKGPYAPFLQPGIQIGLSSSLTGFVYNPQWRVDLALLDKQ
jgi:peptide/nickel transport system substrate-binding protein